MLNKLDSHVTVDWLEYPPLFVCGCYKLRVIIIWQFFMAQCHILNALYHYHLINNRVNQSHCHTPPASLLQTEIKTFPPHNTNL